MCCFLFLYFSFWVFLLGVTCRVFIHLMEMIVFFLVMFFFWLVIFFIRKHNQKEGKGIPWTPNKQQAYRLSDTTHTNPKYFCVSLSSNMIYSCSENQFDQGTRSRSKAAVLNDPLKFLSKTHRVLTPHLSNKHCHIQQEKGKARNKWPWLSSFKEMLPTQFYKRFASQMHNLMQGYYMSKDSDDNCLVFDSGGHAALVLSEEEASIDRQIDKNQ